MDQLRQETPRTETKKRSLEETVMSLEQNLKKIMDKLHTKDLEIEVLNAEIKTAYSKIGILT